MAEEKKKVFFIFKEPAPIVCVANTISVSVIRFRLVRDNVGHSDTDWAVCYLETHSVLMLCFFVLLLLLSGRALRCSGL